MFSKIAFASLRRLGPIGRAVPIRYEFWRPRCLALRLPALPVGAENASGFVDLDFQRWMI